MMPGKLKDLQSWCLSIWARQQPIPAISLKGHSSSRCKGASMSRYPREEEPKYWSWEASSSGTTAGSRVLERCACWVTITFQLGFEDSSTTTIGTEQVVSLLRQSCRIFGPVKGYSTAEHKLGSRSIRSGAAVALFLMDHSVEKIMILGRWSSDAFMVEWTNIMSRDMARARNFRDLNEEGRNSKPRRDTSVVGSFSVFPRFNLGRY
jgi:hypothetical protein